MRVLLFGTGAYYEQYKLFFSHVTVVALLDNDEKKQGTRIDGIPILPPKAALRETYDGIYLLSIYAAEMRRQLENIGVPPEKIFDRDEIYDTLAEHLPTQQIIEFLPEGREAFWEEQGIALLTQALELSGSVVVLFQAACVLKAAGEDPLVVSMQDGPMRVHFLRAGIPILMDPILRVAPLDEIPWIKKCRMLLVNTNLFYGIFRRGSGRVPILWWLHEPDMLYRGQFLEKVDGFYSGNIHVYAAGSLAAEAFSRRCPHWPVPEILRFGIADFYVREGRKRPRERVTFAVIGAVCQIKGQDVFVDAVRMLPAPLRQRCAFWIIGAREESSFSDAMEESAARLPEVQFFGALAHEAMEKIYGQIDVLVCPSREDCMPVVTVEAMMNAVPGILSDRAGTAVFIRDGENGLVFPAGDAAALAEKIKWAAEHPKERQTMGKKARVIYEENFSLSAFEKNLLAAVDEVLGQQGETCHIERR